MCRARPVFRKQAGGGIPKRARDRGELLAAAERSFSSRGYAGASIREIAAEAGFSVGDAYQLFPGKTELFAAVLDALWREYLAATRAALTRPTFAERLAAYTHASSELVGARRALLAIVVAERAAIVGALGGEAGRQLARRRFGDAEFLASAYLGLVTQ